MVDDSDLRELEAAETVVWQRARKPMSFNTFFLSSAPPATEMNDECGHQEEGGPFFTFDTQSEMTMTVATIGREETIGEEGEVRRDSSGERGSPGEVGGFLRSWTAGKLKLSGIDDVPFQGGRPLPGLPYVTIAADERLACNPALGLLHLVIVPTCGEPFEMLVETIANVGYHAAFSRKHVVVLLTVEVTAASLEEDGIALLDEEDPRKRTAERLVRMFRSRNMFLEIFAHFREVGEFPREVRGKSANLQSAYRALQIFLEERGKRLFYHATDHDASSQNFFAAKADYSKKDSDMLSWKNNRPSTTPVEEHSVTARGGEEQDEDHTTTSLLSDESSDGGGGSSKKRRFLYDPHKTFVTVAEAGTLFHHDYFALVSLTALSERDPDRRRWQVYHAPVACTRNLEVVPVAVRVGALFGFFESVGGLAWSLFERRFSCWGGGSAYPTGGSYSVPLLLLEHPRVLGWDADAIAETQHMWFKLLAAGYWDELDENGGRFVDVSAGEDRPSGSGSRSCVFSQRLFPPSSRIFSCLPQNISPHTSLTYLVWSR